MAGKHWATRKEDDVGLLNTAFYGQATDLNRHRTNGRTNNVSNDKVQGMAPLLPADYADPAFLEPAAAVVLLDQQQGKPAVRHTQLLPERACQTDQSGPAINNSDKRPNNIKPQVGVQRLPELEPQAVVRQQLVELPYSLAECAVAGGRTASHDEDEVSSLCLLPDAAGPGESHAAVPEQSADPAPQHQQQLPAEPNPPPVEQQPAVSPPPPVEPAAPPPQLPQQLTAAPDAPQPTAEDAVQLLPHHQPVAEAVEAVDPQVSEPPAAATAAQQQAVEPAVAPQLLMAAAQVVPSSPWVLPYSPADMFDMVLRPLECGVDPSIPVEHLPGGSQLTLVEPAMLLIRLTLRMRPGQLRGRLGRLWCVLVRLLMRPQVRLQYSEHRPLQLIGGLLRLGLQRPQGDDMDAADDAGTCCCSFNLVCALDAGLLRAVEHLLRGWGRADPSSNNDGETSCLCTVNHLLRWPCVWPAMLAHGSVREVASLIVTVRKLGDVFKDRGFKSASNPNTHQDAEVVITAYMAALLEQQAAVLLQQHPSTSSAALALNDALESGALPVFEEAVDKLGGRPALSTPAAGQQRALAVFAVSQWLPNALWLARVVDTWFSADMGRAVLRWVLEAALQCLAARNRSEAEWAAAREAEKPAGEVASSSAGGPSSAQPAAASQQPCGPGAEAYVAWTTFLMVGVDMLAWISKYLAQLRDAEERGEPAAGDSSRQQQVPEGGGGEGCVAAAGGLDPAALLPRVLDVLEVLTLAVPRSVQTCVVTQLLGDKPPGGGGADPNAAAADDVVYVVDLTSSTEAATTPGTSQKQQQQPGPAASDSAAVRPELDRDIVLDEWLRAVLVREGRHNLLSVLEVWAAAWSSSRGGGSDGGQQQVGNAGAPAAGASAALTAADEIAAGRETPEQQLVALRAEVSEKYDIAHLPCLPSPYSAAEVVEAAGMRPCSNPGCNSLEGPSEAALVGHKTCSRCKSVSYCSGECQLEHWKGRHSGECAGCTRGRDILV